MSDTKPTPPHFKTLALISIFLSQLLSLITASSDQNNVTSEPGKSGDAQDRSITHSRPRPSSSTSSNPGFVGGLPIFFWVIFGIIVVITCVSLICGFATRGRFGGGGYGPGYYGGIGGYGPYGPGGYGYHDHGGCGGGGYHHHHGGCGGGYGGHYHSGFHSHSTIFDSGW